MTSPKKHIAYFISSHGFGHAARASAVMQAMTEKNPAICFHIFTKTPKWFFQESLSSAFSYSSLQTDIGLAQKTPFHADLSLTIEQLDAFYPFQARQTSELACQLKQKGIGLVLCDISPLGIAVAKQAELPSVLIENFTWDWIYREYENSFPRIKKHVHYLETLFQQATFHIQTEPICDRKDSNLNTMPVSRKTRSSKEAVRKKLKINTDDKMILITTGGIKQKLSFHNQLTSREQMIFVIPGGNSYFERKGNLIQFPHHSEFFHPDLVNAADAVIGKAGYSTIAEVYHARIPFGFVYRPDFRESHKLEEFIKREMTGLLIQEHEFQDGRWISRLEELLALPCIRKPEPNGADMIANFLLKNVFS
jgi:hypothetical protein